MVTRRQIIASVGTTSLVGCLAQGSSPSGDCNDSADRGDIEALVVDQEPKRSVKLSERKATEVEYQPPEIVLVNTGQSRELGVTVTREDLSEPLFNETVELERRTFMEFMLMAPDIWTVEATLSTGGTASQIIRDFNCNEQTYYLWIQCDSSSEKFMESGLFACENVPVDS